MFERFALWFGIVSGICTIVGFVLQYWSRMKIFMERFGRKLIFALLACSFLLSTTAIYISYLRPTAPLIPIRFKPVQQQTIYGQIFRNETVELDNKIFDHCQFENTKLIYHGIGPWAFKEVKFRGSVIAGSDNQAAGGFLELIEFVKKTAPEFKGVAITDEKGNIRPIPPPIVNQPEKPKGKKPKGE